MKQYLIATDEKTYETVKRLAEERGQKIKTFIRFLVEREEEGEICGSRQ